ncbi:MAG: cytochrome c3 family protein, partial [Gemmataceae bacterium]|nr:cytochrome c3 family protein [Gemmataceae bacterium]
MSKRQWIKRATIVAGVALAVTVLAILLRTSSLGEAVTWQRQASPGRLSAAHAFLENNCAACHTAVKGPEASKCIACHANNESLLQRQPTAFHANIGSCRECHSEHQGINRRPTSMDHVALAKIGLRQLKSGNQPDDEGNRLRGQLDTWINQSRSGGPLPYGHPDITPHEAVLNCATCHA